MDQCLIRCRQLHRGFQTARQARWSVIEIVIPLQDPAAVSLMNETFQQRYAVGWNGWNRLPEIGFS
jgi:hypothetical protein